MPKAEILAIADAVVSALNAANLSQKVEAKRFLFPSFPLEDMTTLHVSVSPEGSEFENASRAGFQSEHNIEIALQKRYAQDESQEIDDLLLLAQEIISLFKSLFRLPEYPAASFSKAVQRPLYDFEDMQQKKQLTSIIVLTFQTIGA